MLGFFPYTVALSTRVRLDENVVIDKPTYGDTDDDVDHIISYGHLTSSSAKPKRICYFDITLISPTLCHAGRYISRHKNYIDMMEFPFDVTSIIQYQIDIGKLHWQMLMKKHHFDIVSIKATLCWTDRYRPKSNDINTIQFRWEHDIDHSMSEIGLNTGAEVNMPLWYRFDIIGLI